MGLFDKEDGRSFLKFLVTLAIPFVLLAIGAVLIAAGVAVLSSGGPQVAWLGLVVVGGVFGLAAIIGFVVIMMMAEAGPF